ncbi:MAG: virulence RhuM family protein [Patescibacteria group bacterium]|nr:virulence RhuM family protein [Patescibacteria group bacterium]
MKNNNQKNKQIIIYESDKGQPKIEVRIEGETVWLTQAQLVELFKSSKANISEHIKNIYLEKELTPESTVRKFRTAQKEGGREVSRDIEHYNLDLIISLGYRVKSQIATKFRIWATKRLKEYIVKGFTMDDERLKNLSGGNYWKELLDRIRDIRSSEKVLYRQVLDLYATSVDYNPKSKESIGFFKIVQNKLHYAAHRHTAAEIIAKRADAGEPFMGLLTFSGGEVTKKDIGIAKNYLKENELKKLNNIVSAYFDLAEVKAMNKELMYMRDWIAQLDRLIQTFDGKILDNAGSVSNKHAIKKAEAEYKKYQKATASKAEKDYLESIKTLEHKAKKNVSSFKKK